MTTALEQCPVCREPAELEELGGQAACPDCHEAALERFVLVHDQDLIERAANDEW